jgi:hypothetical protein
MALDPTRLNPKFLAVGAGLPHLQSTEDVRLFFNFIREDLKSQSPSVFQELGSSQAQDPNQAPSQSTQYKMQVSEDEFIVFSIEDLASAYNDLQNARKEVDRIRKTIAAKRNALWVDSQTAAGWQSRGPSTTNNAKLAELQQELDLAQVSLIQVEGSLGAGARVDAQGDLIIDEEGVPNSNLFQVVIEATRLARGKQPDVPLMASLGQMSWLPSWTCWKT